ncbi:hypothetical protein R6Q59_024082 [Mikania micrantha]
MTGLGGFAVWNRTVNTPTTIYMFAIDLHCFNFNMYEGKEEVNVVQTVKLYAFELACRFFMSLEDPNHIAKLSSLFNIYQSRSRGHDFIAPKKQQQLLGPN